MKSSFFKSLRFNWLRKDHTVLYAKAIMDFFTALIFGTTSGFLVGLIAIPQFAVQMILYSASSYILPFVSDVMLNNFKACGGMLTLAVGLKIADIKYMKVLNLVPALILIFPFSILL